MAIFQVGSSEAEISMSGKAVWLHAMCEDKKVSFLVRLPLRPTDLKLPDILDVLADLGG